jgi:hypothetical protein
MKENSCAKKKLLPQKGTHMMVHRAGVGFGAKLAFSTIFEFPAAV